MATALVSDMFTAAEHRASALASVEERLVSETMGRGLFATRKFKEDEIIFEEIPVISCQFLYNKEYDYRTCDHCLRPLETAEANVRRLAQDPSLVLPHPQCADPPLPDVRCSACEEAYCSEECRSTAWQHYHKVLCYSPSQDDHPLALLQLEWKQHHFPPETLSIMLVARLLAGVLQSPDREAANTALSQFCHATVSATHAAAHKLLGPQFAQHVEALRKKMECALGDPSIEQWLSVDGFQSLLGLVGSNGQGVASSPLAQYASRCQQLTLSKQEAEQWSAFIDPLYERLSCIVGGFLDAEGSGLYRLQSRMNHSCGANACISFPHNDHRLRVTALEDIEPGEQLFINYLDECDQGRSLHSRQKILKENYVFTCNCDHCEREQEHQADVTSDEEMDDDDGDAELG